jgi:predicted Zn-dependent peptidase
MRCRKFQLGILIFAILGIISAASAFDFSEIENQVEEFTLDNGLKFIVLPRHDVPVVYLRTIVNVGSANDPKDEAGLAHMFEHMAFKGTKEIGTENLEAEMKWMEKEDSIFAQILEERAKRELADSAKLADLEAKLKVAVDSANAYVITNEFMQIYSREGGVDLNAGTGFDMTAYLANYPANKLELWMAIESDRFLNPVLHEFYKEKEVIAEERRMTRESSPQGKLREELTATAFMTHPYGRSGIGPMSDIKNYYRPSAIAYFKKFYVPSNMVVAVVGDVEVKNVKTLAEKYFGRIPYSPKPKQVMTIEAPQYAERRTVVKEKAQPMSWCAFHVPSARHPDMVAINALADYLGQGRTSLLYKKLVKEDKIAIQVMAFTGYPAEKYPTLFSIISIPAKDHTNEECDQEIIKIIEQVKSELIPDEELDKIKARAKADLVNEIAQSGGIFSGLAFNLAYYEIVHGDWRAIFQQIKDINALTAEDIKRVANDYLDINRRTLALLEPEEE